MASLCVPGYVSVENTDWQLLSNMIHIARGYRMIGKFSVDCGFSASKLVNIVYQKRVTKK